MFKGRFEHTLDAKGRAALPAKLRKNLNPEAEGTVVVTRGANNCIMLYPKDIWEKKIEAKLQTKSEFKQKDNRIIRMLCHNSSDEKIDDQGRILIPKDLLQHAQIKTDILILGSYDKIEIWDPDVYNEYNASADSTFEDLAEDVFSS